MNFLKVKTIWTNGELWLFKICIFTSGIIGGIYFKEYIKDYLIHLIVIFSVTLIWVTGLWIKKMKA